MKRDLRCAGRTLQKNRRVARGLSSHLRKNHRREFSLGIDLPNPGRHLTGRVGRHRTLVLGGNPLPVISTTSPSGVPSRASSEQPASLPMIGKATTVAKALDF